MGLAPAPRSAMSLWQRIKRVFTRRDPAARADAERVLLEADFGPAAAEEILGAIAQVPDDELPAALERAVVEALGEAKEPGALARAETPPTVILVIGVNGTGKTTTVAKLAHR